MKIFLKKKISDRIAKGHQWIFRSEVGECIGEEQPGGLVDVFSSNGTMIGRGLLSSPDNNIIARLYARDKDAALDFRHWQMTIAQAVSWRQHLSSGHRFFRWVNGDIDNVSGLTVDEYGDNILVATQTLAMDLRLHEFIVILKEIFPSKNVIADRTHHIRRSDGIEVLSLEGFIPFEYEEQGVKMWINSPSDYSMDRILIKKMIRMVAKDLVVWDVCCGNGGLGLNALGAGANTVHFIDNNETYTNHISTILKENNLADKAQVHCQNAFYFLKNKKHSSSPGLIVIDTPNFPLPQPTDTRNPYRDLAKLAIENLSLTGGFLIFIFNNSKYGFYEAELLLQDVTHELKLPFTLLQTVVTPPDYGVNILYPHTNYLKAFLLQIPKAH